MGKPTWFIGVLLSFLALIVGTQLYSLQRTSYTCDSYISQLRERLDRTEPGTPQALQVAQAIERTAVTCRDVNKELERLNSDYLDTTLALLGGAGVVGVSAMMMGRNERRQLRRTDPLPMNQQPEDQQQDKRQDNKQK